MREIHKTLILSLGGEPHTFRLRKLDAFSGLAAYLDSESSTASAAAPTPSVSRSVEAPVNITVNASGTDSQALGQSIYNSAQRYLVKTLRQTMQ